MDALLTQVAEERLVFSALCYGCQNLTSYKLLMVVRISAFRYTG